MSSKALTIKSAWKKKIELNDIFDDTFLSEKDMALQPLEFIFEEENIINEDNHINNMNSSFKDNSSENNSKEDDLNLYDSNIIIISSTSDDSNKQTSFNQIEKQIEKINQMLENKKRRKKKINKNQRK